MTDVDIPALRALAQQATPGPWEVDGGGTSIAAGALWLAHVVDHQEPDEPTQARADAAYIAAVSPTVLTTILDELGRLRGVEAGAREAGRMIDRLYEAQRPVIDAAGLGHLLTDDGDGDWEQVWELLAQIVAAARTVGARRDAQQTRADRAVADRDALAAQITAVRAELDRWHAALPEHRTPAAHGAAEVIRNLRTALDAAQTGEPT